jgi:hypothetical protein
VSLRRTLVVIQSVVQHSTNCSGQLHTSKSSRGSLTCSSPGSRRLSRPTRRRPPRSCRPRPDAPTASRRRRDALRRLVLAGRPPRCLSGRSCSATNRARSNRRCGEGPEAEAPADGAPASSPAQEGLGRNQDQHTVLGRRPAAEGNDCNSEMASAVTRRNRFPVQRKRDDNARSPSFRAAVALLGKVTSDRPH